ncbi:hypothetical protein [Mycobacterium camsae]|uniref:hypothetical protein n=1 Tax=Mycobacterium gordonae TaxID=1778 RepID=UPI001F1198A7|nr:hypothetical protein [Mycobacterium gordonae]
MTAHDDESAGQETSKTDDGAVSTAEADDKDEQNTGGAGGSTEKPEPDEEDKEQAKEMMTAYEDRPTLVLPGSGKTITGTAVNDWLDDDGNPKYAEDEDSPAAKAKSEGSKGRDEKDQPPAQDEAGKKDDGDGESRAKNTAESERAAHADETTEDENKSVEELNQEAEQRVKDNLDKDKDFNKQILEATKQDREDREKAGT